MLDRSSIMVSMNRKSLADRAKILQLLVEGNSLRSTSRIADCSINTVTKLLVETAEACAGYQDKHLVNLPCKRIQVDEIWSFVYSKDKNTAPGEYGGSVWTWTSICADTKLVPSWLIGGRDAETGKEFMRDLASRMRDRIQLTSDGFTKYRDAVEEAFGPNVDYAMLVKVYDDESKKREKYLGAIRSVQMGSPDIDYATTAHVERQNLTMRMSIRRFGRKTNAFSKKVENHAHAVALHFMYYNFCRIHKSLRVTPAMADGVTDMLWSLEDVVRMADGYWNDNKRGKI